MHYALGSHRPQEHLPLSFTERHLKWKLRILSFNAGNHWAIRRSILRHESKSSCKIFERSIHSNLF